MDHQAIFATCSVPSPLHGPLAAARTLQRWPSDIVAALGPGGQTAGQLVKALSRLLVIVCTEQQRDVSKDLAAAEKCVNSSLAAMNLSLFRRAFDKQDCSGYQVDL